ncbi:Endonuclease/exonuclease/phosphatase [Aspergillus avenaceus]|uniref:Endonuclease/exonuclease/phosphatase n=1 Tax=Aspergillus avenaceus TaxID=36643 RepID=A0A5N6TTT1_ASPAV|nr:Endonuclease/exonuclease/phosphatase [Aspergillus avenaceus]
MTYKLQPYYTYSPTLSTWTPVHPTTPPNKNPTPTKTTNLTLTTWNIDFQAPCKQTRTKAALTYLSTLSQPTTQDQTQTQNANQDSSQNAETEQSQEKGKIQIIFLQEMIASDLHQIQQTPWIQANFHITDITASNWTSSYGTVTLIDKRCDVHRVFRVPFPSRFGRDGLFVDISIPHSSTSSSRDSTTGGSTVLRLCNTHLESLTSNPPLRPVQLHLAAKYMHGTLPENNSLPTPTAAILAGDLNAFAPEDRTAPGECGLSDAFLVLGGLEDTEESYTWGQQVSEYERERFGCSRMDKVLFCGGLSVRGFERIGVGEKVWIEYPPPLSPVASGESEESETGEELWVTDHLGLRVEFTLSFGSVLDTRLKTEH